MGSFWGTEFTFRDMVSYVVYILWKWSIDVIDGFSGPSMCTDLRSNLSTGPFKYFGTEDIQADQFGPFARPKMSQM